MVNVGIGIASILGLLDIVLAVVYFGLTIFLLLENRRTRNQVAIAIFVLQLIVVPLPLLVFGTIMFVQGWRLDPILQFAYLLLQVPLVFLAIKDWVLSRAE